MILNNNQLSKFIFFIAFLLYSITTIPSHAATYSSDMSRTSVGESFWDKALLTMRVSISGSRADYTISKTENGLFTSAGDMYLQAGSPETWGKIHDEQAVYVDDYQIPLSDSNLDAYPETTFPKQMFARYVNIDGGWAWVGPLTILKNLPVPNETDYTTNVSETSTSDSSWGPGTLRLKVSVVGSTAYFMVTKADNTPYTSDGTMFLQLNSSSSSATPLKQQTVQHDYTSSALFTYNLDSGSSASYPEKFYARYKQSDNIGWAWVGPITISKTATEPPPPEEASGTIYKPTSPAEGNITVNCNASDPDGLNKVSLAFVPDGPVLVLCQDGTANSCSGTSGNWNLYGIDPTKYGVTGPGTYTLGLWARDDLGNTQHLTSKTISWSPSVVADNSSTGTISQPSGTVQGNVTVQANGSDLDGLKKVSVAFVANGTPLVLCQDGTTNSCSGTSDNWTRTEIDPTQYGVTGPGTYTLGLWIRDDDDNTTRVDTSTINWSPPVVVNSPPTGTIEQPTGLVQGPVALRASAADADGLRKVSAVFTPNGKPLVLCDDNSVNPCTGSAGSWAIAGINPIVYGAAAGEITLGLHVQDDLGGNEETLAASEYFSWVPEENQFPKESNFFNICVGHNYEQQMPLSGVDYPQVSLTVPKSMRSGEKAELTANGWVDDINGGRAFYYYCTQKGTLLYDDAHPTKVTYVAPLVTGVSEEVKIFTQIGDGLGYIDTDVKTISVTEGLSKTVFNSSSLIYPGQTISKSLLLSDFIHKFIAVKVRWPGSDIDLILTRPDGVVINYTDDKVFAYYEANTEEYYIFYNDMPGTWTFDLKAVDVHENGEPYEFTVLVDDMALNTVDSDGDTIPDYWEYAQFGDLSHDGTTDADNDGLNDLLEYRYSTDPNNPDSDMDGMEDGWEVLYGLNPLVNDADLDLDLDGFSNLEEYEAGTDPLDLESQPLVCTAKVPEQFGSIQNAIDQVFSSGGGAVCVAEGTYTVNELLLRNKVYLIAESENPASTILDGNKTKHVITMHDVKEGGIIGFTIRNSRQVGNGAGVNCTGGEQNLIIAKNIITDNVHGIRLQGDVWPLIINNTITGNRLDGIRAGGSAPTTILNNIMAANRGAGVRKNGKAISIMVRNDSVNNKGGNFVHINTGEYNFSQDPKFINGYRLAPDSPCINAGRNLDGSVTDLGAYGSGNLGLYNFAIRGEAADTDKDGIADYWEILFFGNLNTVNNETDYDSDGYSDLYEYYNYHNGIDDPENNPFDPTKKNAPDGEGYNKYKRNFLYSILQHLLKKKKPIQ